MSALPFQLVATLDNLVHNTQHALDKANALNPANIPETSQEPGPYKDVCKYVDDLITLTTSGSGLNHGGKTADQGERDVYASFRNFAKHQKELFATLTVKAVDVGARVKASRLVAKLRHYEGSVDAFITQLEDQCPSVAEDIKVEHKKVSEALEKAIAAWALPASPGA